MPTCIPIKYSTLDMSQSSLRSLHRPRTLYVYYGLSDAASVSSQLPDCSSVQQVHGTDLWRHPTPTFIKFNEVMYCLIMQNVMVIVCQIYRRSKTCATLWMANCLIKPSPTTCYAHPAATTIYSIAVLQPEASYS